tara:strand:+ start:287 stop:478 length:192 start_codon:yes stop_codon:yes gene_type:complete
MRRKSGWLSTSAKSGRQRRTNRRRRKSSSSKSYFKRMLLRITIWETSKIYTRCLEATLRLRIS